ncbi:MAG: hypothetical protein NTY64_02960, partial [Deltaproteobacteria bacterium]|nr:hypothetical protein [Deltaproteobacteria bacterium]
VGISTLRKKRFTGMAASFLLALLFLSLGGLSLTIVIATQGYRAFTREEVAARVKIEPLGAQLFRAEFRFPDGRGASFQLAGDELYVDAHILKWKPWANFLGLHTAYELDRVAGRYPKLGDEQKKPRTVFTLAQEKPVDIFHLRQRFFLFRPFLDAEYGSATFIAAEKPAEVEIRVSTTGLLIRKGGGSG